MSALTEYIKDLKNRINEKGNMNEKEIIRYVYIDLGKKMDFDLNYTFGNSKERSKIYYRPINEEELNHVLEIHTAICKSLSYLLERILKEFNINIWTYREDDGDGKHVYNIVRLKNGECYILDLEDDLEFIQSGAKTQRFGRNVNIEQKPMMTEEELKNIDINKADYIPNGYYLEDMLWMIKLALSSLDISTNEKLEMVLKNLNVYTDNKKVKYRERIKYYTRIIEDEGIFTQKELRKIHQIDCYKKENDQVMCKNLIVLEENTEKIKIYLFPSEDNGYEEISMEKLVRMINDGLKLKSGIPGLKKYLKEKREEIEK